MRIAFSTAGTIYLRSLFSGEVKVNPLCVLYTKNRFEINVDYSVLIVNTLCKSGLRQSGNGGRKAGLGEQNNCNFWQL